MYTRSRTSRFAVLLLAPALLIPGLLVPALLIPSTAVAQNDFLLQRPSATVSLFGGWASTAEGGDTFEFVREHMTLEQGDFASPMVLAEVAWRVSELLDLSVGIEHSARTRASELRDWVTMDDQPIPQSSRFSRTRFQGSAKVYLLPRGRSVSRYAWVPNRVAPYLGGGVGWTQYSFTQTGDFVDFETLDIFEAQIDSEGGGVTPHAVAGLQLSLTPRILLKGEYRYVWGEGTASISDFSADFGGIDLSGSGVVIGAALRI